MPRTWQPLLLLFAGPWPQQTEAAGGAKLWELGQDVEENPITVFVMFGFTVFLTIMVEMIKHHVEHNTHDTYRLASLSVIYGELMMIGVISFLLILCAELGLTDIRVTIFCDDPENITTGTATGSTGSGSAAAAVASASGSGSECGFGFDILLFEYAHLVLFAMGLMYCVFIQIAFGVRDRHVKTIAGLQAKTIMTQFQKGKDPAPVLSIMGWSHNDDGWGRTVLTLRSAIVLLNEQRIRNCCQPQEQVHEQWLASFRGEPAPSPMPSPEEALVYFDMGRFVNIAVSEALVDLLHVPSIVWGGIILMAGANLINKAGVDLADAVLMSSAFGPSLSCLVLWRMSVQLSQVVKRACGHPRVAEFDLWSAQGDRPAAGSTDPNPLKLQGDITADGLLWDQASKEYDQKRTADAVEKLEEMQPWACLTGCCDDESTWGRFDPLDPGALELQIQLVVFASCFYFGQVIMLTTLINDHIGFVWTIVCWLVPMPVVVLWMPRCILIFALTHKTRQTPRTWLRHALKLRHDEPGSHGHGHGGGCCGCCGKKGDDHGDDHGHGDGHGHGHEHGGSTAGDHKLADKVSRAEEFGLASRAVGGVEGRTEPAPSPVARQGSETSALNDSGGDFRSRTVVLGGADQSSSPKRASSFHDGGRRSSVGTSSFSRGRGRRPHALDPQASSMHSQHGYDRMSLELSPRPYVGDYHSPGHSPVYSGHFRSPRGALSSQLGSARHGTLPAQFGDDHHS